VKSADGGRDDAEVADFSVPTTMTDLVRRKGSAPAFDPKGSSAGAFRFAATEGA